MTRAVGQLPAWEEQELSDWPVSWVPCMRLYFSDLWDLQCGEPELDRVRNAAA